jgi:carbon-monoxide dehydrogenase iron sulfur subunit
MKTKILKPDTEKCNGALACEKTCSKAFFKVEDPALSSIRHGRTDSGAHALNVCNQCGECIAVCPVEAIRRNKMGVVMVSKKLCVGCFMCVGFCPTLSMRRAPGRPEPFKCTSCGLCVESCPAGALEIVEEGAS